MASWITKRQFVLLTLALAGGCGDQPGMVDSNGEQIDVLSATESSKDFGEYVIHFNALRTDELTPEVAREYSIVRSQNRAMLNISILHKQENAPAMPVAGAVAATAVNLTGQLKNLLVREIREGDAIYYIAETPITNGEVLVFSVDVTPQNEASRFSIRFQKQFFVD